MKQNELIYVVFGVGELVVFICFWIDCESSCLRTRFHVIWRETNPYPSDHRIYFDNKYFNVR